MTTAIRSSTLWRTLVFLIVVIAPARAFAAGAPTPAPTPAGESYFITWNATAKGSIKKNDKDGQQSCEYNQSSATQGSAIVKFKQVGNPPKTIVDSRIVAGYLTDERDEKLHNIDKFCGDWIQSHDHYSYQPQPIIGMDWWMYDGGAPRKQADGSWLLMYPFHGRAAFDAKHQASYKHLSEATRCYAPCLEEGPMSMGCVRWGKSALHPDPAKVETMNQEPQPVGWTYAFAGTHST
jgi:hypothetical protein